QPSLPLDLGTIPADESVPLHAAFVGVFAPQGRHALTVEGTFEARHDRKRFKLDAVVVIPPSSPGKGALQSVAVHAGRVFGAPFPSRQPSFGKEVNGSRWTVPTGPVVAGTPTPNTTRTTRAPMTAPRAPQPEAPAPILFEANASM